MKKILWIPGYLLSFVLGIFSFGYLGVTRSLALILAQAPENLASSVVPRNAPSYDASKPTVAILLGDTATEPTDFLGPYAMFAESGAYNVYAVASSRTLRTLAGGLDVVPQLSFESLDALLPRGPEIIVVPAIVNVRSTPNAPVLNWLRRQERGQSLLFSWCEGAEVLAAAGLLDGKVVTTHWASIDRYERAYPAVRWLRGERYVDSGRVLTTAGLTSGIDATLHLLKKRNGAEVALRVAQALHVPHSAYVLNPHMPQYSRQFSDSSFLLNFAFGWPKTQTGVWLYDGIGELDLAAAMDVYQATDRIHTVASSRSIVSNHGLQFVPRWNSQTFPKVHRMLVPAGKGSAQVAKAIPGEVEFSGITVIRLENDETPQFPFLVTLNDLAQEHGIPTAAFAAKRLEVRSHPDFVGSSWPFWQLLMLLLSGMAGGAVLAVVSNAGTFVLRLRSIVLILAG